MRIFQIVRGHSPSASNNVHVLSVAIAKDLTADKAISALRELRRSGKKQKGLWGKIGGVAVPADADLSLSQLRDNLRTVSDKILEKDVRNLFRVFESPESHSASVPEHSVADFYIRVERFGAFLRSKNLECYARGSYNSSKDPDAPYPFILTALAALFPKSVHIAQGGQQYIDGGPTGMDVLDEGFVGFGEQDYLAHEDLL